MADGKGLEKVPSGIRGLDEITFGGLPKGRPILVSGGPGCGKTLLAMEFVARGIVDYGEPGVFVAFEEKVDDLEKNFASLGFDLPGLVAQKKLALDHIYIDRSEFMEAGEYDLEGLFIRLGALIDSVGAKRIAIDTIEAIFSGFCNEAILRAELRRLFLWLKDREVTAIITGERGDRTITEVRPRGVRGRLRHHPRPPGQPTRSRPGASGSSSTAGASTARMSTRS